MNNEVNTTDPRIIKHIENNFVAKTPNERFRVNF